MVVNSEIDKTVVGFTPDVQIVVSGCLSCYTTLQSTITKCHLHHKSWSNLIFNKMPYVYEIFKHSEVHTAAHQPSDIHKPVFLLMSLFGKWWQTKHLSCFGCLFWLGEVPFRYLGQVPLAGGRTSLCDFPFPSVVSVTQE